MATPTISPAPYQQDGPPEGRGKAMAMQTFLARGGGLVKNRKGVEVYADGPMKGMTQAQAEADFENKWSSVGGAVKDKYARKAGDILSPSEKSALAPVEKKDMSPAAVQKRRMAQYGHEFAPDGSVRKIGAVSPAYDKDTNGVPDMIQRPTANPAASPIGTPEERAKVSQMMAEGEAYAMADVGGTMMGSWGRAMDKAENEGAVGGEIAKRDLAARQKAKAEAQAANEARKAAYQEKLRKDQGLPTSPVTSSPANISDLPTDERMRAQGKTNAGGAPAPAPAATAAPTPTATPSIAPAMDGSAVLSRPQRDAARVQTGGAVNRLTGLPAGYMPGDALPAGADASMRARATESTARQAATAPRAIPVVTPAPRPATALQQSAINRPRTVTTGVEGAANREMKRQAGINANPSTVNLDDPRKFFTGRTLPLDQLVKRQTVSTPVRR